MSILHANYRKKEHIENISKMWYVTDKIIKQQRQQHNKKTIPIANAKKVTKRTEYSKNK